VGNGLNAPQFPARPGRRNGERKLGERNGDNVWPPPPPAAPRPSTGTGIRTGIKPAWRNTSRAAEPSLSGCLHTIK
jgi:hypothetical protein